MRDAHENPVRKVEIHMKKIFALMLVLLTLMMAGSAMAELQTAPFEGVWVQFEDGFEILLPANWLEIEVTEEMTAGGVFYVACSEDGANTVQLAWAALETDMTAQEVKLRKVWRHVAMKL